MPGRFPEDDQKMPGRSFLIENWYVPQCPEDARKIFFNPIQKKYPLIIDLINTKDEVVDSQYLASASDNCVFENILPGEYTIREIEDKNENKKRDTGNFLGKIQPEKTYFNDEIIKVRANWILRESF